MIPIRHRLTLKLALVIAVGITCVHAVFGYLRVVREAGRFREEMTVDHQAIAHALRVAVVSTATRSGREAALDLIREADLETDRAHISWLESPQLSRSSSSRAVSAALPHSPQPLETVVVVDDDGQHLRTMATVVTPRLQGVLRIEESMADEEQYIADTVSRTVLMTGIAILLSATIIFAAGIYLLDRRLRPLLASVQRIGRGDFTSPLRLRGRDEMALLGDALDRMAENLRRLGEKNEREAQQRIEAVQQLRHADRLATVGKMAAGVAHELGTPLNVVTARAKMIARGSSVGDEAKDDARVIFEQGERITHIIRQMLDFARPHRPRRSAHDVLNLCRKVGRLLEPMARKQGVVVSVEGAPLSASVDEGQLHQVVTNLIVNAIQAQPKGGAVRVHVDEVDGGLAQVRVEDDGPGIPESLRERVFDPFFSTKDVGAGTGLGLSVSYGIVREHGGRFEVSDAPSGGACLKIFLPLTEI